MIIYIIEVALMIALWVTFILLFAHKIGVIEWLQVHGGSFISKMAQCDFCLSWWLSLLLSLVLLGFIGDLHLLVVPFLATPIARKML